MWGKWVYRFRSALLVFGTVGAVVAVKPGWLRAAGLDVWNVPAEREHLREEVAWSRELDEQLISFNLHRDHQSQLIAALALGNRTLADAAAELVEFNRDRAGWLRGVRGTYSDAPDDRTACARLLVRCVELETDGNPERHAEAAARLEAELHSMTGHPAG